MRNFDDLVRPDPQQNKVLEDAPHTRHILGCQKVKHYVNGDYHVVGTNWQEIFFHRERGWSVWCGTEDTQTTEAVDVIAWAEIPDPNRVHWRAGYIAGVQLDGN